MKKEILGKKEGMLMKELFSLLKKGNKSALIAAVINTVISVIKGVAYIFTGNVAMFAETMHSLGDAANQFFVFIGSSLSKKAPTKRFPNGFGRLVNLVLLGAILIVGVMSYETIKEGLHHIANPQESKGFLIILTVLVIGVILESFVLFKAMKEVIHETGSKASGLSILPNSFSNLNKAKPATKLVFMEDFVATLGGLVAIVAVVISHFTSFHAAEGYASILIGVMMLFVVFHVFMDNAAGVLGESDEEMEEVVAHMVMADEAIKDIRRISVIKEGEGFHVEVEAEVDEKLTVAVANDIKDRISNKIMELNGVTDVSIEFDGDDGVPAWNIENNSKDKQ